MRASEATPLAVAEVKRLHFVQSSRAMPLNDLSAGPLMADSTRPSAVCQSLRASVIRASGWPGKLPLRPNPYCGDPRTLPTSPLVVFRGMCSTPDALWIVTRPL